MSDQRAPDNPQGGDAPDVEVLPAPAGEPEGEPETPADSVVEPAKVMRIGAMVKQLLDEVRHAPLDEAGRNRLREIHEQAIGELCEGLSPDLRDELGRFSLPFGQGAPSEAELRVAQAQLVGWLEGLFHGIQATLFAQQMATRAQIEELQRRGLPAGARPPAPGELRPDPDRPGTYL